MPNRLKNKPSLLNQIEIINAQLTSRRVDPSLRKPLWQILLDGNVPIINNHEGYASIRYTNQIPDVPANAREAAQRRHHLSKWLEEGKTYDEFVSLFGPER